MTGGGEWDLGHHVVHLHDGHAHGLDDIEAGIGDESRTWKFYGWQHGDKFFRSFPPLAAKVTPMVSFAIDDAKYLQAMVGGFGFLLPIAGFILGLMSTLKFGGFVVPPDTTMYLVIMGLSIFSAFAGMMALVPIIVGAIVTGNLTTISSALTLFLLGCIWISGPQLARRFRPLNDHRTMDNEPFEKWWIVVGDYVIQLVMTMFILGKLTIVLPIVCGLNVPAAQHEPAVWVLTFVTVLLRQMLETVARHHYPRRLFLVTSDFHSVERKKVVNAAFVGGVQMLIVFGALSLVLGNSWQTWTIGGIYGLMLIVAGLRREFPEKKWIYRLTPIGIARIVLFMLLGEYSASYFIGRGVIDSVELTGAVFLVIAIFLLILTYFGKFPGDPWPKNVIWKILGVITVAVLIGLGTGTLSLI